MTCRMIRLTCLHFLQHASVQHLLNSEQFQIYSLRNSDRHERVNHSSIFFDFLKTLKHITSKLQVLVL